MESIKIELLLEKYFEGQTTIAEEKELKDYFSSSNVAQHLVQYQSLFGYFSAAKEQKSQHEIPPFPMNRYKKRNVAWLSIAASVVVLFSVATLGYFNYNESQEQDLGTYQDPEVAFRETQKVLSLLSQNVNVGIESVQHINEFEDSKNLIFKK